MAKPYAHNIENRIDGACRLCYIVRHVIPLSEVADTPQDEKKNHLVLYLCCMVPTATVYVMIASGARVFIVFNTGAFTLHQMAKSRAHRV